jgi:hypothetical protein
MVRVRVRVKVRVRIRIRVIVGVATTGAGPSVFGQNFQSQSIRKNCHLRGMVLAIRMQSFKRAGVGTNGNIECKFLSGNAHWTSLLRSSCTRGLRLVQSQATAGT